MRARDFFEEVFAREGIILAGQKAQRDDMGFISIALALEFYEVQLIKRMKLGHTLKIV